MAERLAVASQRRLRGPRRLRHRQHVQRVVVVLAAVIAAVSLLSLAVPRTVALVLMLPAEVTVGHVQRRLWVDRATLDRAVDAEMAATAWVESGTMWQQVAMTHLGRLRLDDADRAEKVDALLLAEATLQRSLARRPGNPFAWWQLAAVMQALRKPSDQITSALYLSVVTGNMVTTLVFPRLGLALPMWPRLDQATRAAFLPQLAVAFRGDPRQFVALVRRSSAEEHVRVALRVDRELLNVYNTLMAGLPGHPNLARRVDDVLERLDARRSEPTPMTLRD